MSPRRCAPLVLAALLAGCMVVPRTTTTYDPQCQQVNRRMELTTEQVAGFQGACRNSVECGGLLAAWGVVAAASTVVSGSIAVVGNVVYWLEEQGQCRRPG